VLYGQRVAVVMPAFNVEDRIVAAVRAVPDYIDQLVVVDDGSVDGTVAALAAVRRPVTIVRHVANRGVGAAIATGYVEALQRGAHVVVVMAGDGQMDAADLPRLIEPVACGAADYAKGNRFRHGTIWRAMPTTRVVGNILLSLLTKISSGYWRLFDSQSGYTAISARALRAIDCRVFARYGYPNDLLARLRAAGARVVDVPVRPVYDGQRSGIRLWTVVYPILFILLASFARRLWQQRLRPLLPSARDEARLSLDADRAADQLLPAPPP
jgi:glycosyltransferase involved in cell wall biosynthesis